MPKKKSLHLYKGLKFLLGLIISFLSLNACFQGTTPNPPDPAISHSTPKSYIQVPNRLNNRKNQSPLDNGVPEKALEVLKYVQKYGHNLPGYEGGRKFGNYEKLLPAQDNLGRPIQYQEWDINPHRKGINRGAQRLITSSDHKAYYTENHYQTFKEVQIQ